MYIVEAEVVAIGANQSKDFELQLIRPELCRVLGSMVGNTSEEENGV